MKKSPIVGIRKKKNSPSQTEGIQHILKTVSTFDDRLFFVPKPLSTHYYE
jgi:hypothetical protein